MTKKRSTIAQLALASSCLWLAACSSTPPPPDWQMNAKSSLDRATNAWLSGDDRVEATEFARARSELARTGRAELVARAELTRCATRVASLVFEACTGFDALALDAGAEERAYARYLEGAALPADAALLPAQHRAAAQAISAPAIASIGDPLGVLVAAGVALRRGQADPAIATLAVEKASQQGWRRPLLAWLKIQLTAAETAGNTADADSLRRRIDLVSKPP
ncbi:MAG: hypothetical protein ABI564_12830 [Ideonella sp.]